MAIKGKFDDAAFEKAAKIAIQNHIEGVYDMLEYLGNECVREARSNGDYNNITGNLRNSIGFAVFHNDQIVRQNFQAVAKGEKKSDANPIQIAQNLAGEVAKDFSGKIVLVVVAGMHYATYVEAKGRNVLTSAEQLAKQELPKLVKELFG